MRSSSPSLSLSLYNITLSPHPSSHHFIIVTYCYLMVCLLLWWIKQDFNHLVLGYSCYTLFYNSSLYTHRLIIWHYQRSLLFVLYKNVYKFNFKSHYNHHHHRIIIWKLRFRGGEIYKEVFFPFLNFIFILCL